LKLGDAFPPDLRRASVIANVRKGLVTRDFLEEITHPKIKIFILVGLEIDSLTAKFVLINSAIPLFIQRDPEKRSCQLEIGPDKYDFLDHTSYADCQMVISVPIRKLVDRLLKGEAEIRGHLSDTDLQLVLGYVTASKSVARNDKTAVAAPFSLPAGFWD